MPKQKSKRITFDYDGIEVFNVEKILEKKGQINIQSILLFVFRHDLYNNNIKVKKIKIRAAT